MKVYWGSPAHTALTIEKLHADEVTNRAVELTNRAVEVTNRAIEVTNRADEGTNRAVEVTNRAVEVPSTGVTSDEFDVQFIFLAHRTIGRVYIVFHLYE